MKISLKKIQEGDLSLLHQIHGEELPNLHKQRLEIQSEGKVDYLLVMEGEEPVGHMCVVYDDYCDYHRYPMIQDLYVRQDRRRQGIAKRALSLAEQQLQQNGHTGLSLDVDEKKIWLQNFYEDSGFITLSGPHEQNWVHKDKGCRIKQHVYHMRKVL